eukprot:1901457-Ditylum_brightwellii.AAC.1
MRLVNSATACQCTFFINTYFNHHLIFPVEGMEKESSDTNGCSFCTGEKRPKWCKDKPDDGI